jgi:hypothetical protein
MMSFQYYSLLIERIPQLLFTFLAGFKKAMTYYLDIYAPILLNPTHLERASRTVGFGFVNYIQCVKEIIKLINYLE